MDYLKLIKQKKVDIKWLKQCFEYGKDAYSTYNTQVKKDKYRLTKTEYLELMKVADKL